MTPAAAGAQHRRAVREGHDLGRAAAYAECVDRRDQLRDFLRTRRARLTPEDVGLPDAGVRRTPGLRREEVAVIAGASM
ncbi:hypothetical protein BOX37_13790 [Nocardia mangyaensis]|uniref:Uncharacterized protein n=1 Tax=Nocardia mangyaensis TaxID=2213200 RepID=A0A1J0VS12_9NOCA|nr:hypothetical protein BOX37_13790 [Nocardia mangyaensis]